MGATFMAGAVLYKFGFSPEALFAKATQVHPKKLAIMEPGSLISNPLSAISLGLALMFGTAGLPHILMRLFTVKDAQAARKSVFYATGFIGYFYILGIIFENQNVAFMVGLAFAIAASCNFPVLVMSIFWKGLTTRGAMIGGFLGLISAVVGVILSPAVWEAMLGNPKGSAPVALDNPALVSITRAFAGI